ncbi:hypothetical protein TVAG_134530 [Trichomonas vaginalis G3]|uniref:Uncharacterized protein n=1 Tax=Trichomonas vaginalis (strain ATCC PRA-98 / G3) TaxID=412133 RepID=A2FWJ1_TRIV3|nr:protein ubiquitination [Trichomonas vaginalis G3]EAX90730.1 hypothetical protein TVAG_134530 [Trichomonas vaginalis G3]KAI5507429.1 protein ubiquitination [Trichomonas vaginalis G3]|eukprot:XP_001303660.1 hypothetical protein [Trichomonas vaginalis G3]
MKTAKELSNIFDFCNFSIKQFIYEFTNISKRFKSSEVFSILQHAKIRNFEDENSAFGVIDVISILFNNSAITDAASYIKKQKTKQGKYIKYLLTCVNSQEDISKAIEDGDYKTIKFAVVNGYGYEVSKANSIKFYDYNFVKDDAYFESIYTRYSLDSIRFLITRDSNDINLVERFDRSNLHYAALNNDVEVIKYFFSLNKIDINARNIYNITVLHYAALNSGVEIVKC